MSRLAAAIGALVLLLGAFVTYVNAEVLDPDRAGERAADAIVEDAGLRTAIAAQVADSVPDLPIVGGPGTDAVATALANPAAAGAFGNAIKVTVEDLTSDDRPDPLELNLAEVATEAVSGVGSSPLDLITDQVDSLQIDLSEVNWMLDLLDLAGQLEPLGLPLIAIGFLLLVAAVLLARRLADGVLAVGLSIAVAGCLGIAALIVGRVLVGAGFDDQVTRDAVEQIWDALGGPLMTYCMIAAGAGFAVAVAAWLLGRSRRPADPAPRRRTSPHAETLRPRRRADPPPPPPPPPRDPGPPPPDQDFGRRHYR